MQSLSLSFSLSTILWAFIQTKAMEIFKEKKERGDYLY